MTAISLRLPDDIEAHLKAEAQLEGKTQSEIARQAITEYLARREKERFMAEMVAEMRTAYANPDIRRALHNSVYQIDGQKDRLMLASDRGL